MTRFRILLAAIWIGIAGYTAVVIGNAGVNRFKIFLSTIRAILLGRRRASV